MATAEVLQALLGYGDALVAPTIFKKGLDWLTGLQNEDGGFGQDPISTIYETALAYAALVAGDRDAPAVASPVHAYFDVTQGDDGCWNADPYATALVIQSIHTPDDGLFCNGLEVCNAIDGCSVVNVPNCDDGIACTVDACDEAADACTHTPNNAVCDDGLFCNGAETCDADAGCVSPKDAGGNAVDCSDGIPCTTDACNENTDSCTHTPSNAVCDDGVFCNGSETCNATQGCLSSTRNCADAFPCTIDACDEAGDACTHTPDNGACADSTSCTDDVCNAGSGCVHTNNAAVCDDGNECTTNDHCSAGICSGQAVPNCPPTTTTTEPTGPLCGDFDGSGTLTAADALGALRFAVGLGSCALDVCDYNGDTFITAADALAILRVAVGQMLPPNCPKSAMFALPTLPPSTTTTTTDPDATTTTLPAGSGRVGT
jgi:hypothetical protein